ncbi:MAG: helix-turn-helix transcriptional regulator [Clostridia bacterium]|nr:helix-turn-helix transcriptional regulator [Clostridia bacterium]
MDSLKRIRELLDERKMTMYQLSQRAGIPQSTLSNLFLRNNAPTLPTLEKICNALDITVCDFFKTDEEAINESDFIEEWNRLSVEEKRTVYKMMKLLNNKK